MAVVRPLRVRQALLLLRRRLPAGPGVRAAPPRPRGGGRRRRRDSSGRRAGLTLVEQGVDVGQVHHHVTGVALRALLRGVEGPPAERRLHGLRRRHGAEQGGLAVVAVPGSHAVVGGAQEGVELRLDRGLAAVAVKVDRVHLERVAGVLRGGHTPDNVVPLGPRPARRPAAELLLLVLLLHRLELLLLHRRELLLLLLLLRRRLHRVVRDRAVLLRGREDGRPAVPLVGRHDRASAVGGLRGRRALEDAGGGQRAQPRGRGGDRPAAVAARGPSEHRRVLRLRADHRGAALAADVAVSGLAAAASRTLLVVFLAHAPEAVGAAVTSHLPRPPILDVCGSAARVERNGRARGRENGCWCQVSSCVAGNNVEFRSGGCCVTTPHVHFSMVIFCFGLESKRLT